jgi:hypothetical protein
MLVTILRAELVSTKNSHQYDRTPNHYFRTTLRLNRYYNSDLSTRIAPIPIRKNERITQESGLTLCMNSLDYYAWFNPVLLNLFSLQF